VEYELLTDLGALERIAAQWDALAVCNKRPTCGPAWMLGWLRHLAPTDTTARVVVARERDRLIGLAPFFVERGPRGRIDYRLMGESLPRAAPLALPGREWEVAEGVGRCLHAEANPRPDLVALENGPTRSAWSSALRETWPGGMRPVARQYLIHASPVISLREDSFEAWLSGKSANFRSQMRRIQRGFQDAGGVARVSTMHTLERDLDSFMRLHAGRWQGRGRSSIVARAQEMARVFLEAGQAHVEEHRFRLFVLEVGGEPISAQLFFESGGEVLYFNGGWDERYAKLKPAMLGILYAVEDAFARGDERIDLAPGDQPYKLRFADGNDPVCWTILMVPGRRLALTAARVAPMLASEAARSLAKRSLPAARADRVRRVRKLLRERRA
jgi:CelD/BcsL family acetyltransferase involved in cellulose biosynthesis